MGLFDRIFKRSQVSKSNAAGDRLAKIKKQYNLIDTSTGSGKDRDLDEWFEQQQKTKETIKKNLQRNENARKKRLKAKKSKRKKKLVEKFGKELGTRISKDKLWIGMSEEILKEMKGNPKEKNESVSRQKIRKEYFYDGYKNRLGNMTYRLKVVLIDGIVDKWTSN